MALRFPTMAERPDLRAPARALMSMWPAFMHHDPVGNTHFPRVRDEYSELQFFDRRRVAGLDGMVFPESGPYVVPGALVPVEQDRGVYVEPNVWMLHRV